MAEAAAALPVDDATPAKRGRRRGSRGLVLGLVAGLALGACGFYAIWSGRVDPLAVLAEGKGVKVDPQVTFVAMEPIMISLPPGSSARHLRFTGQLEVERPYAAEVATLSPRVLDTLNTFLRAVEVRDLENPAALLRLRAQMLRRVQVVAGEGRVRDLLITEFILN